MNSEETWMNEITHINAISLYVENIKRSEASFCLN